jgi:2-keto-4-pentenoate hydratase
MIDVEFAAGTLADLWTTGSTVARLPDGAHPSDLGDGYRIQDLLIEKLGHRVVGWKLGATAGDIQAALGLTEPVSGRLLEPFVEEYPATIAIDDFAAPPLLECEIGFILADDLPATAVPYNAASVRGVVACLVPVIEVASSRFTSLLDAGAAAVVADNVAAAHVVMGEAVAFGPSRKAHQASVTLRVNGDVVAKGSGDAVLGDPLAALAWLANHLATRGLPLTKGDLVITGSMTGMTPIGAEDVAMADFGSLGRVSVHISG